MQIQCVCVCVFCLFAHVFSISAVVVVLDLNHIRVFTPEVPQILYLVSIRATGYELSNLSQVYQGGGQNTVTTQFLHPSQKHQGAKEV